MAKLPIRATSPAGHGDRSGETKPKLYEMYKERHEAMPEQMRPYFEQSWFRDMMNRKRTGDPEEDAAADRA